MDTGCQKNISDYEKLLLLLSQNEEDLKTIKDTFDTIKARQKQTNVIVTKMLKNEIKAKNKPTTIRKPCGFARPSLISDEMCDFLKLPHGSTISRTEVTKQLINYIKTNNLQNTENKKNIVLDETLHKLFDGAGIPENVTYFTMQKYVNHHFPLIKADPTH